MTMNVRCLGDSSFARWRIATARGVALDDLSLEQSQPGEIFAFLGPNGGGKTTLFRLLSTLIPLQAGRGRHPRLRSAARQPARSAGESASCFRPPASTRNSPWPKTFATRATSTAWPARELRSAQPTKCSTRLGLADGARDRVETLSGGLRRRVELAKGMLHRPRLLLLDEPSTGLDPGARSDLWEYLQQVRDDDGVTVVLTTHLLEEADKADRIAILHEGRLVALDTPDALRATVGGDSITIRTERPAELAAPIRERILSARPRSSTAPCGWSSPTATSGCAAGRGVSRRDRVDHAGQADAGRRVHRPHRPSLLAMTE